jgi:Rrf2 family protein
MRITTQGVYGLVCVLRIARAKDKQPVSMQIISKEEQLSVDYIEQLLLKLRRADIVKSIRGRTGGYILSRSANRITLKDIVEAVEGRIFEAICLESDKNTKKCLKLSDCSVRKVWLGLRENIEDYLINITIKDLLNSK